MLRTSFLIVIGFLIALSTAASACAQRALAPIAGGTRVRVQTLGGNPLVGTVDRFSPDTLFVRSERTGRLAEFPSARLRRVEVSAGRRTRGRAALVGGAVGLVVGSAMAAAFGHGCSVTINDGSGDAPYRCGGRRQTLSLVLGIGAVGAGVGAAAPPRERWRPVLAPQAGRSDGGGRGLSFDLRPATGGPRIGQVLQAGKALRLMSVGHRG
ncbi:MAG: hypothetical protein JWM27_4364 [Gemmatimonadetes bacterium]|nr:hypothetical protein [Gemmatimonadota bacterium]